MEEVCEAGAEDQEQDDAEEAPYLDPPCRRPAPAPAPAALAPPCAAIPGLAGALRPCPHGCPSPPRPPPPPLGRGKEARKSPWRQNIKTMRW